MQENKLLTATLQQILRIFFSGEIFLTLTQTQSKPQLFGVLIVNPKTGEWYHQSADLSESFLKIQLSKIQKETFALLHKNASTVSNDY